MEIQQHDGVVVDVAGSRQGFAKLLREGEVLQGEREAPGAGVLLPSLPPLFIGLWEAFTVGDRSRILKFPTHHQDPSMEYTSNEGKGVHLHTLVDCERKRSNERG